MNKVQFTFSCRSRLTFELNNAHTTEVWASLLSKMSGKFLHRSDVNHKHGFASMDEIRANVNRLKRCAEYLAYPLEPIKSQNWQSVLNNLHINFPEFFKQQPMDPKRFRAAHEMNLLIHWLEYELPNFFQNKNQYLFNLDFNHHPSAYNLKSPIPDEEFDHFSADLKFGNLHLHYIYIGRHFLEMFDAHDMVCPSTHYKAQHEFNATCGLVFSEPQDEVLRAIEMRAYYNKRGGQRFFGFDYDDPKFAKGFFKLGQLQDIGQYELPERRQALRLQLKNSHIVGWDLLS